jgi:hypothetical protein
MPRENERLVSAGRTGRFESGQSSCVGRDGSPRRARPYRLGAGGPRRARPYRLGAGGPHRGALDSAGAVVMLPPEADVRPAAGPPAAPHQSWAAETS